MNLAESLKAQREILGISQPDLAKALETSQQNISRWESGKAVPGIDFCLKMAKFYNTSLDELLGRENEGAESTSAPTQPRDELILLQAYRAMSPGKKKALFNMLDLDEDIVRRKKETS